MINTDTPHQQISEEKAFARLASLCSRAEHSSGEVLKKMRLWGLDDDASRRVLNRLTEERYVDDRRFCRIFVDEKLRLQRWGRHKIVHALRQKGVGADIYIPVIEAIDADLYEQELQQLLTAKRRTLHCEEHLMIQRLTLFALNRGFTADEIRQCLSEDDDMTTDGNEE